jgi:hypothetical protein
LDTAEPFGSGSNARAIGAFGTIIAGSEAKLGPGSEVCQSNTGRSTKLKHQRRFGTEVVAAAIEAARIKTLIDSINRSIQSLNYGIETEEKHTTCRDRRDPAYSVLARSLIARRAGCDHCSVGRTARPDEVLTARPPHPRQINFCLHELQSLLRLTAAVSQALVWPLALDVRPLLSALRTKVGHRAMTEKGHSRRFSRVSLVSGLPPTPDAQTSAGNSR